MCRSRPVEARSKCSGLGSAASSVVLSLIGPVGFFAVLTVPGAVLAFAAMRAARSSDRLPADERSDAVSVRPTSAVLVELDPRVDPQDSPQDVTSETT
jgi:hypothetical protein